VTEKKNEETAGNKGISTREFWERLYKTPGGDRNPFDPELLKELREYDEADKRRRSRRPADPGTPKR
jgi:hypothetical protein